MMMELINKYVSDPTIKDGLPEFDFVWSIGQSIKNQGCYCGINQPIMNATPQFNELVENLSPELVTKLAAALKRDQLCFGIVKNGKFESKCY